MKSVHLSFTHGPVAIRQADGAVLAQWGAGGAHIEVPDCTAISFPTEECPGHFGQVCVDLHVPDWDGKPFPGTWPHSVTTYRLSAPQPR